MICHSKNTVKPHKFRRYDAARSDLPAAPTYRLTESLIELFAETARESL